MPTISPSQLNPNLAIQNSLANTRSTKPRAQSPSTPVPSVKLKRQLNVVYQGFSGGQLQSQIKKQKSPGQKFLQSIPDLSQASPEARKEAESIGNQMDNGFEFADIGLSSELGGLLNLPTGGMRILASRSHKTLSSDSVKGLDLRKTDLGAYQLEGVSYSADTQFPKGFDPSEQGMLRASTSADSLNTHLANTSGERGQRLVQRVLQSGGSYPNPNPPESGELQLLTQEQYYQETANQRQNNVKARFASERSLVEKHGGYEQAVTALRTEAGADEKKFNNLLADKLGHHRNAYSGGKSAQEAKKSLELAERKALHNHAKPSQSEIDMDWEKLNSKQLRAKADQVWSDTSKERREEVLTGFYSEQVALERDKLRRVQDFAERNPEKAELSGMMAGSGLRKLDSVEQKIRAGDLPAADVALKRSDTLESIIKVSDAQGAEAVQSIKAMKPSEQRLHAETEKYQEYQKEGWWNDSPAWEKGPDAFLKDVANRPLQTLSPVDADRTLQAVRKMRAENPNYPGLANLESKARRQIDLQRVGDQWSGLDGQFKQILDHQGIVGRAADWTKNNLGRKDGWVIDSERGSSAVLKSLKKAHHANLAVKDLANFKGSDAEFKVEYQKRVNNLASQLQSVQQGVGKFEDSQANWVDGVSDLASATAALAGTAAAPVTGGASLALGAGIGASVKVGTKGLEAVSGNKSYQGGIGSDLLAGGLNGALAAGTNQLAQKAVAKFLPSQAGMAQRVAVRGAVAAGEGATDGYLGQFGNTLIQGGSLSEAHGNGTRGAVLGAVLNTGMQGATGRLTNRAPDFQKFKIKNDKVKSQKIRFVDPGTQATKSVKKALKGRDLRVMTTGYSKAPAGYDVNTPRVLDEIGSKLGNDVGFVTSPTASTGSIDALTSSVAQKQGAPVAYLTADRYVKYIDPKKLPAGIDTGAFAKTPKLSLPDQKTYLNASADASNRLVMAGGRGAAVTDFQNAVKRGNKVVVVRDDAVQAPAWNIADGEIGNGSEYVAQFVRKETAGIPMDQSVNKEFADFMAQNSDRVSNLVKVVDASDPSASKLASDWLAQ